METERIQTAKIDEEAERNVLSFRFTQITQKLDFLIRNSNNNNIYNDSSQPYAIQETNGHHPTGEVDSLHSNNSHVNQINTNAVISEIINNNNVGNIHNNYKNNNT